MLLLSSLWAGSTAMASYCAVNQTLRHDLMLCGNGTGGTISFAELGLTPPQADLPDAEDCDCELHQDTQMFGGVTQVVFKPIRYVQIQALTLTPSADEQRAIRSAYLSRGPPSRL